MEIKAIETHYKGYRFRSRTEARWAIFFDTIGWKWDYEAEGYALPSGYYLPDFYFPEIDMYAEVKGKSFTEIEKQKCKELSTMKDKYGFGVSVLMLEGPPALKTYESYREGDSCCGAAIVKNYKMKYGPLYYGDGDEFFPALEIGVEKALSARFEK